MAMRSDREVSYNMCLFLPFLWSELFFNLIFFGNMAVLLQEINKKSSRFKEKLDTAKTAVKNLGLPPAFENKVINYLIYTEGNLDKQREFELMNNMISPSLKMQIIRNIFYKIVISNPIFGGGNQDLIEHVLQTISTISFLPEDSIIKQDDDGDKLFFCYQGELEVLIADENSEVNRTNILSPGAMFGEIALISNCKRTATIKCLNYCTCAALTDDQLRDITRKYPEIMSKFKARRSQYNDCWKSFMKKLILTVEYFQKLKPTTIEDLIYSMRQEYIGTNRILYKPGDCIENIRFIVEGSMQVIIQEVVIDHLRQAS